MKEGEPIQSDDSSEQSYEERMNSQRAEYADDAYLMTSAEADTRTMWDKLKGVKATGALDVAQKQALEIEAERQATQASMDAEEILKIKQDLADRFGRDINEIGDNTAVAMALGEKKSQESPVSLAVLDNYEVDVTNVPAANREDFVIRQMGHRNAGAQVEKLIKQLPDAASYEGLTLDEKLEKAKNNVANIPPGTQQGAAEMQLRELLASEATRKEFMANEARKRVLPLEEIDIEKARHNMDRVLQAQAQWRAARENNKQ